MKKNISNQKEMNSKNEKITVLGDSHGGKATALVEKDGLRFVRKPRSAATERAWEAFLLNLKTEGFLYIPGAVKILSENAQGHEAELVENLPARNENEIKLFYKRCGALLFFAFLFSSNDLHCENIIASGAYPVLVDYETLLTGEIENRSGSRGESLARSVLKSHLLPNWSFDGSRDTDCGGLTGNGKNRPILNGVHPCAYEYESEIIEGFEYAFRFSMKQKELLERSIGLFGACRFRVLLRPTQAYAKIIAALSLLDGEKRLGAARALLARAYERDTDSNRITEAKKTLQSEMNSVLNGDIPLFYTLGTGRDLCDADGAVQRGFLSLSPVEKALGRLAALSEADLTAQSRIISQSLAAVRPISKKIPALSSGNEDILERVVSRLDSAAIPALSSGWLQLERAADSNLYLQSVGYGLYDGLIGILCCYAAVFHKTRDPSVRDKLNGYYEMYREFALPKRITLSAVNAGLQSGAGGHILALHHIAELTGQGELLKDANAIAAALINRAEPRMLDPEVLCGVGGLALALPCLDREPAQALARSILPCLTAYEPRLTGFAHGAAGAAAALGALGRVLNSSDFDGKIISILNWENKYFDNEQKNWYDLRNDRKRGFMSGWCSGAPGIGMARQRLFNFTENEAIKALCARDIENSRAMLLNYAPARRDSLCCGAAARLMAASRLGVRLDGEYDALCKRLSNDALRLFSAADSCDINSGLMQGVAGIGYALAMYSDKLSGGFSM